MNHAKRKHALLSASGSERWLNCPGSVRLEQDFPDTTSPYAQEGTAAHELSEIMLRYKTEQWTKQKYSMELKKFQANNKFYCKEMHDYIDEYTDLVMERINEARARVPDAVVLLEERLDYSAWTSSNQFGTGDVIIIADGIVEIIDLKYGEGVKVSAIGNSQMRLYALGAYDAYNMVYDIDRVRMTIIQPRLNNYSSDEISIKDLLEWAENVVRPKAQEALSGQGTLKAGEHCRFCKARSICRERARANLELAKYDFALADQLSVDEIADVLMKAEELVGWINDVKEYALKRALEGTKFPGMKLVEGRSNRKYKDENEVIKLLKEHNFKDEDIFKPRQIKGIGDLEKLLGKKQFDSLLGDLIIKPPGKPVLVPETDKRPEIGSKGSATNDFADDLINNQ